MIRSRAKPPSNPAHADFGPLTPDELRRMATYLQYRLDRAGESGDMKMNRDLVARFILVIEAAQVTINGPAAARSRMT